MKELYLRVVAALRVSMLTVLDTQIARAPAEWRPGLQGFRDLVADTTSTVTADLVGAVFRALGEAFKSMKFGPATSDPSDTA